MIRQILAGQVRHLLTAGAGILVTQGLLDGSMTDQAVAAGMFVFAAGWSLLEKWLRRRAPAVAAFVDGPVSQPQQKD